MDYITAGLPVHQQLLEFTQTHVYWVGDCIQPSHPLLSPSPPAFNLSQHQGLFKWVSSSQDVKLKVKSVTGSVMSDPLTTWAVARQAPLSMEFSRQEYWSGLPFPSPGDLPYPGVELKPPAFQADSLPSEPSGKPILISFAWWDSLCVLMLQGHATDTFF